MKRRLCERYLDQLGPSGRAPTHRPVVPPVLVRAIWLRRIGEHAEVLAEMQESDGTWTWRLLIREHLEGSFGHIIEPEGMLNAPRG